MPTKDRREARTFSQTVPPLPPSDHFKCKWKKIQASTAKCDVCGKRNTKGSMVGCEHCDWQTCHGTCPADPKCMHRRDGERCSHHCDHESHHDVAPANGSRRARVTAVNVGSARPRCIHAAVRGRACESTNEGVSSRPASVRRGASVNAGASNTSLLSDHDGGFSVRIAGARRLRVGRQIIASALFSRPPSASVSGDLAAEENPRMIPSITDSSTNASHRNYDSFAQSDLTAARSTPSSPPFNGKGNTSSFGTGSTHSTNQADGDTVLPASNPSSIFRHPPVTSICNTASENACTSCCEEALQFSGANLTKEDLDGAECLLALRKYADIKLYMAQCGKRSSHDVKNTRGYAFFLARKDRQWWERANISRRRDTAHDVCRNMDGNGDDKEDDREYEDDNTPNKSNIG
ncbi:predicted protein [Aspergillus nidulans FGSC A4]|uniref:Uncharacterized protein n=1 Tax=Emericella nidulans (strain FGSC A4 / ATCC 38163 / CBS 112.46 / NRRL 194 / M139) TaxID=227321 RepID=Q5BC16_EMENI|nr:hypothetical protein [Aspergillus nidulans FGSC A4]EAA65079.1 predicted protein [Aspergillus nidulans FGSC A4]CBF85814.1 TPA: conserved hypothetical protein [Aspergillus nidulans FGSC A4]|eukprot:XP_659518.1 predicted protein [Aspergillus nidulans FGSC A4]